MDHTSVSTTTLITIGALLMSGLLIDTIGRRTPIPRVTLLIVFGFVIGPEALNLLPRVTQGLMPVLSQIALVMIGFLLGGRLTGENLRKHGKDVIVYSTTIVLITAALVFFGLYLLGVPVVFSLMLAGIATATAPAATLDVIDELNAKGDFVDILTGIVALDDAWGLILFSILLALAQAANGGTFTASITNGAYEMGVSIFIGLVLGITMALLSGRVKPGKPTLVEALGIVFLCGGIANYFEVSFLISAMVLGLIVAKFARHHEYPFHEIENIEWPFLILFFVLAGSSLDLAALKTIGMWGMGYIFLRTFARFIGGRVAGALSASSSQIRNWIGLAMLPQAGVALGMALIAAQAFPELEQDLMAIVIGSTVAFELVGPVFTRIAIRKWQKAST